LNELLFKYKESQQENMILGELIHLLTKKLADAEVEKSILVFESNNAILLKQHLLGVFSFYSDIIEKLNKAIAEDKITREFAQEENTLLEIVGLLTENVRHLEKINQKLEANKQYPIN
jgi:hypothetical protein